MTKTFEIGQQWRCIDGSRVIILDVGVGIHYWHYKDKKPYWAYNTSDLIEPWTEPRSGEVWVNVWVLAGGENGDLPPYYVTWDEREQALNEGDTGGRFKLLARVKVPWTEGQRDN